MTSRQKLSVEECKSIARDLGQQSQVTSVTQRFAGGGYPVVVIRIGKGSYRSIATFAEYVELKKDLANL
jgi:hypothetical protein